MRLFNRLFFLLLFSVLLAPLVVGQSPESANEATGPAPGTEAFYKAQLIFLIKVLAWAVLVLVLVLVKVVDKYFENVHGKALLPRLSAERLLGVWRWLTGLRPVAVKDGPSVQHKHTAVIMDRDMGHEYDGIREFDNGAPPLFNYILYGTVIFAVVYLAYFHVFDGPLQREEFVARMQFAEAEKRAYLAQMEDNVDENTVTLKDDPAFIAAGQQIYVANCVACHGANGEGGVGPNFTDPNWLHGCSINDVFKTVKYGVPTEGMKPWEAELTPKEMAQVSNYVLTLQGKPVEGGKDPEGEVCGNSEALPNNETPAPSDSATGATSLTNPAQATAN